MSIKRLQGTNKKTGHCKLGIEGGMTIYQATDLFNELIEYQNNYADLKLDLSAVTDFDTAGVQILMALTYSANDQNKLFCVLQSNDSVDDVLNLYQLSEQYHAGTATSGATSA